MRKILSFASSVLLSLTVAGSALAEPMLVTGCETALKDHLGANSGYVRVGFSQLTQQLTRPDFKKYLDSAASFSNKIHAALLEGFDTGKINPQRYIVFINYTVLDANGLAAATTAKCEYVANQDAERQAKALTPDALSMAKFQPIN